MFSIHTHASRMEAAVSLMVRNMSNSHIFLKKGVPVVHVMSASLVPPTELLPEMEATLGTEAKPESMSVVVRQEKLLEKLNLDGLAHWSPRNAAVARELVLAYHDVFALESNELGCTSAIEHEIHIDNSEPFKEQFRHIPPPLLGGSVCITPGHAGCRSNSSEPITMVQRGSPSKENRWHSALLC